MATCKKDGRRYLLTMTKGEAMAVCTALGYFGVGMDSPIFDALYDALGADVAHLNYYEVVQSGLIPSIRRRGKP